MKVAIAKALSLCIATSMLPATAFADIVPGDIIESATEAAIESAVDPGNDVILNNIAPFSMTKPSDGIYDNWEQDPNTVKLASGTNDGACTLKEDSLFLKAGTQNRNNCDGAIPPAMFISPEMTEALSTTTGSTRTLSMNFIPDSPSDNICFGIALNYKSVSENAFIGYNTIGGWFFQHYDGGTFWPSFSAPALVKGRKYKLELQWTDGAVTSFKLDDVAYDMPSSGGVKGGFSPVTEKYGVLNKVAIKTGTYTAADSIVGTTSLTITDLHYTNQAQSTYYSVGGVVTDKATGTPLEGATITIGNKTATTDENGVYNIADSLLPNTYTIRVVKEGYANYSGNITISNSDISNKNISLNTASLSNVTGTVIDNKTKLPIQGATVTANNVEVTTDADGKYTLELPQGTYNIYVSAPGYSESFIQGVVVGDTNISGKDFALDQKNETIVTLNSAAMDVQVDANFPRVIKYTLKNGKSMEGQTNVLDTIELNGTAVKPTVTSEMSAEKDKIIYTMIAEDKANSIDATITASLSIKDKELAFEITNIVSRADRLTHPLQTIFIPNHSLVSVNSKQDGYNLIGSKLAASTITKGDFIYNASNFNNLLNASVANKRFMYAFVTSDKLSAGISTNSQIGSGAAGSDNNRVTVSAETRNGVNYIGLGSTLWYFDRFVGDSYGNQRHVDVIPEDKRIVGPSGEEMPFYAKVVVTDDMNDDGEVSWQDAAILARDTIIHKPYKSQDVRDIVGTRIAMNFGSHAQNPFLTTLDNVKRIALNTDGLGQAVLLKGYANEGHDSGHPDFWDIGKRMGGPADMNTMMELGKTLGARFGIHINTSEFYPEAKAFSEEASFVLEDGGLRYGWEWIDQGIAMNGLYDLAMGYRRERLNRLKDLVGDNMDFVYVDVWGNGTSGSEDAWQTRKLGMDLTENGWRIVNEWGHANEWESTFQHWVSDYGYGGYDSKGKYNSEVMRFMLNSYKDSFAPDFPHFGGAANAPLLGGPIMQGFEGWQGDGEYNETVTSIFEHLIPTKFLQHYDIMKWTDAAAPVTMFYQSNAGSPNSSTVSGNTQWTPEAQIKLTDNDGNNVVVTRGTSGNIQTYSYSTLADKQEYRSRVITLNGKVILKGAAAPAASFGEPSVAGLTGNQTYLIPWLWDSVTGARVAENDEKLYHYSDVAGQSTWDLPDNWTNLANVKVYELTDNGRTNETVVTVSNGKITLDSKARVPYVVVRGDAAKPALEINWSTGMHLKDVSFNSKDITDNWEVTGSGSAVRYETNLQVPMMKMTGQVEVSQVMTDLEPGKQYVVYVGVDNRSDSKAYMKVSADGEVIASNYANRSIAKNYVSAYVHHTGLPVQDGSSYFQNMHVFFTAPETGTVRFALGREAGQGNTYFDDIRVAQNPSNNFKYDENGNIVEFTQGFESVAAGLYPFVVGGIEGVADNRQHLSERNGIYTQAGWDNGKKRLDDVIEGDWSIKVNGKAGSRALCFQTLPQTFRFEPGVTYDVIFDYEMGADNGYVAVYGTGEFTGINNVSTVALPVAVDGNVGTCSFTITGDPTGQTWFGIYSSTGRASATTNSDLNNFVLDNLTIVRSTTDKEGLAGVIATASAMSRNDYVGDWNAFLTALSEAKAVLRKSEVTQEEINTATTNLENAINSLRRKQITLSGSALLDGKPAAGVTILLQDTNYVSTGKSVTTGADGKFSFKDLGNHAYKLRVSGPGYKVQTITVSDWDDGINERNIVVEEQIPAAHQVLFEDGDISMMGELEAGGTADKKAITFNGSGAMEVTFKTTNRNTNNLVDKTFQMADGTISFDVTALDVGKRFGLTLRGTSANNRMFIGQFEGEGGWGWEYWNNGANLWSGSFSGPALSKDVTRHLEVSVNGKAVILKVDGVEVINVSSATTANFNPPVNEGYFGFNHMNTANSRFVIDNFVLTPQTDTRTGSDVTGKVLVGTMPVGNAQIVIKDSQNNVVARTVTGLNGVYNAKLRDGNYTVTVSTPNYESKTVEFTVLDDTAVSDILFNVNISDLQKLYNDNKDKVNDGYTAQSWNAFQAALAQAKEAIDNPTTSAVNEAFVTLYAAISNLAKGETRLKGDIDGDGVVAAADAKLLLDYIVKETPLSEEALQAAKAVLETNEKIGLKHILAILKLASGKIS